MSDAIQPSVPWEYAPAPESTALVTLEDSYGLFVNGEFVEPKSGKRFVTINPATEEPLAQIAEAGAEDVALAVEAARDASDGWRALPGSERAKYLYRIARQLQERAREFAVLESMNGGKPIKESRDIDIPLAAAHFFYYAGWADKLEYAFPGRRVRPIGVAGQIIPWNFPMLMAAWKLAPALATGNTLVLKPAETTPLTALLLAQVIQEAELPPGVVNVVTGAGETGSALVGSPVDKIAFTGSTEVGKRIQRSIAGSGKRLTLELGGKAANIVFEDAPLDQAVEGVVNGIFFNQGHVCCAGSRLLVQEPVFDALIDKLKARLSTLRVGDPLDKNTDVGAINSRAQLEKIEELVASGVAEGAEIYQPECVAPGARVLVPAHAVHRRLAIAPHRARGDLRSGALDPHVPHAGGGGREGEQHAVRVERGCLDREGFAHPVDGAAPARGRRLGEHVQPLRPFIAVRRVQGERVRTRRWPAWPRAVPGTGADRRMSPTDRLPVKRTAKLFIGGKFPRSESGRSYEVLADDGRPLGYASQASRKDLRDAVVAARAAQSGWAGMTAYNRGQILYRVAELMEGRREQFRAELADAGASDPDRGVDAAIDRWVWYAGWCDKVHQALGATNPVAGPYFNFTIPEPTGVVGVVAPQDQSLLGLVSRLAPAIVSGNTVVAIASEAAPMPAVSLAEVLATSDVPGGVVNLLTGSVSELVPWLAGHMDVNAIDVTGVPADLMAQVDELAAENVKRVHRGPDADPFSAAAQSPYEITGAHGVQDRLAPDGRLTQDNDRAAGARGPDGLHRSFVT